MDVHLLREKAKSRPADSSEPNSSTAALPPPAAGLSRGSCFLAFEDWRSTILAVDNMNGARLAGRTLRVDHAKTYNPPRRRDAARKDDVADDVEVLASWGARRRQVWDWTQFEDEVDPLGIEDLTDEDLTGSSAAFTTLEVAGAAASGEAASKPRALGDVPVPIFEQQPVSSATATNDHQRRVMEMLAARRAARQGKAAPKRPAAAASAPEPPPKRHRASKKKHKKHKHKKHRRRHS